MSVREEFVAFAQQPDANIAALCRVMGISRKTGYKWLARRRADADEPLVDRPRRPLSCPARTAAAVQQQIVQLRQRHPAWGARKLKRRLEDLGQSMPARSTVNGILARHGLIDPAVTQRHAPPRRFERSQPNELWQMDFKGHFALDGVNAGRCHPLTMLDDCSRFNLLLRACPDQRQQTVKQGLIDVMRQYGMPQAILADNGPPWGDSGGGNFTALSLWLMRRGICVLHGRPHHPQTQGKEERFHRTLQIEVIGNRRFTDHAHCQRVFDDWREVYNLQRPHEALGLRVPGSRYTPARRAFCPTPPPIQYAAGDTVRRVCAAGRISYRGKTHRVGKAFAGEPIALRHTSVDGTMDLFYCHQRVAEIDLRRESKAR